MSQQMEQPPRQLSPAPKDPDTAFLIEIVGGFFGLLGLGYIYVGRTEEGVIRLIVWVIYNIVAYIAITALITIVIGCFCLPVQLAIQIGVALWSANALKKSMLDTMN
jgi:TM2 domain-containing membrane protein YozV